LVAVVFLPEGLGNRSGSGQGRSQSLWDFIENRLVDRVHGEWFWRINVDGQPDLKLPKVSEWKGPYHGSRACLETLHRLRAISTATRQPGMR